jgi:hypothetical protein
MQDAPDQDAIWALEEGFWTAGADHYRAHMHPECLMALPDPVGVLAGPAILAGIEAAARWRRVRMSARRLARPASGALVLAYRAEAQRDGEAPYAALCTSVYVRRPEGWRLIQHHQTPR